MARFDAELVENDSIPEGVLEGEASDRRTDEDGELDADMKRIVDGMSKMHDAAAMQAIQARRLAKAEAALAVEREVMQFPCVSGSVAITKVKFDCLSLPEGSTSCRDSPLCCAEGPGIPIRQVPRIGGMLLHSKVGVTHLFADGACSSEG